MNEQKHVPTEESRRQVKAMAGFGLDGKQICIVLGVSPAELIMEYSAELAAGPVEAEVQVRRALFNAAVKGNTLAAIRWLEQNAGGYS